jgi:mono/diheme cytochrome c family protein
MLMFKVISLTLVVPVAATLSLLVAGCGDAGRNAPAVSPQQDVARGKYLVENVGMCADCHTPMTPTGPDKARWLQGADLPFAPTIPIPDWAAAAPAIAGLPSLEDDEAISLLTTGVLPGGSGGLRPPMPQFRFNQDDARAIVAYLRSLAPAH